MKTQVQFVPAIVIAILISVFLASCGAGGGSSFTEAQASSFVSLLAGSGTSAMGSAAVQQGRALGILEGMSARILKAAAIQNPKIRPADLTVSCNSKGTCQFTDEFNVPYSCQSGGTMEIAGDLSGTGTETSAYLSIQIVESINGWTCDGPTINGDPYVQVNGTYTYPADSMTMTMSGGFLAGTQSCMLDVTINANSSGGDISGTACGYNLNSSF